MSGLKASMGKAPNFIATSPVWLCNKMFEALVGALKRLREKYVNLAQGVGAGILLQDDDAEALPVEREKNFLPLLVHIEQVIESLSTYPDRGSYPNELSALGIREYRQRFFKPYRIIYRVMGKRVYIYLIADGRRDFQTLLARRMLSS